MCVGATRQKSGIDISHCHSREGGNPFGLNNYRHPFHEPKFNGRVDQAWHKYKGCH